MPTVLHTRRGRLPDRSSRCGRACHPTASALALAVVPGAAAGIEADPDVTLLKSL